MIGVWVHINKENPQGAVLYCPGNLPHQAGNRSFRAIFTEKVELSRTIKKSVVFQVHYHHSNETCHTTDMNLKFILIAPEPTLSY
jgi:hypothetical protein